jgi:YD repeat-containing protein
LLTTTGFAYDPAGNRTSVTSARNKTTTFAFDAMGRMTSVVEPTSATHSITTTAGYDANGNRTRVTDGRANATTITYNPWNLPDTTTEPSTSAHPGLADRQYRRVYDGGGLPVEQRNPGGVTTTRAFDELGRLSTESAAGTGVTSASRTFGWDAAGRQTSVNHPDGTVNFVRDDRGLLTQATSPSGNSSFTYDGVGRLAARTDASGTSTPHVQGPRVPGGVRRAEPWEIPGSGATTP